MFRKSNRFREVKAFRMFAILMRLMRWPNLIIIILTQSLMRYFVIIPFANAAGAADIFPDLNLVLLILATEPTK